MKFIYIMLIVYFIQRLYDSLVLLFVQQVMEDIKTNKPRRISLFKKYGGLTAPSLLK